MKLINRAAVIVRPKAPFLAWAAATDPDAPDHVDMIRDRVAVYLVEAADSPDAERRALDRHARVIFESELEAWYRDPASWPPRRGPSTLHEWFGAQIESMVVDLADHELTWEDD